MLKKIRYMVVMVMSFLLFSNTIMAYGFEVSTTSNSVIVGNSITLTIKGNDLAGKFSITSSNNSVVSVSNGSVFVDNDTQQITLNTKNVGAAVITIIPSDVTSYGGESVKGNKTINITVKEKPPVNNNNGGSGSSSYKPVAKSSNSYLTSLTIDGYELDNAFDKETLEYTVTLKAETEKIKINAQLADSQATVTGVGEVNVSDGTNVFEIIVTAENGSKRTYKLTANVLELEPIKVTIDKEEYTVVRKRKDLPKISEYYEEANIKINDNVIEGYYNDTLKYQLIGLKNSKGNIDYYIYNNGKYTLYKEYTFNGTVLQVLDKSLDESYKKTNFVYDGDKITSYQEVKLDLLKNTYAIDNNDIVGNQFYLFYAKNIETGKEYLYQYDALEKTVQRYNTQVLDMYKDTSDTYYMYLLGTILILGVILVIFSVILLKKSKKNKKDFYLYREEDKNNEILENINDEKVELPIKESIKDKNKPKKKNKK